MYTPKQPHGAAQKGKARALIPSAKNTDSDAAAEATSRIFCKEDAAGRFPTQWPTILLLHVSSSRSAGPLYLAGVSVHGVSARASWAPRPRMPRSGPVSGGALAGKKQRLMELPAGAMLLDVVSGAPAHVGRELEPADRMQQSLARAPKPEVQCLRRGPQEFRVRVFRTDYITVYHNVTRIWASARTRRQRCLARRDEQSACYWTTCKQSDRDS